MAFVGLWEGDEPTVYRDIVGVPTVCNGHTGPDVKVGDVWTKEQCDAILIKDINKHGEGVLACTAVPINQNQYDAFASLTFNIGVNAFCKSTLVRHLNAGEYASACRQILRWDRAGGKKVKGLTNRRKAEYELCIKPIPKSTANATV